MWIRGGGRNFERPIFRNLKIANVNSYERSSYSIFLFAQLFFHFFLIAWTLHFVFFFNFNAPIFYNFPNLIFFGFLKFFLINEFCKFMNLKKFQLRKFDNFRNCQNLRRILEVSNFKNSKFSKLRRFSTNCKILELFVFSISRITRNFFNSHIWLLI